MGQCYVSSVAARAMQVVRVLPEIVAQDERHEQANRVISMAVPSSSENTSGITARAPSVLPAPPALSTTATTSFVFLA